MGTLNPPIQEQGRGRSKEADTRDLGRTQPSKKVKEQSLEKTQQSKPASDADLQAAEKVFVNESKEVGWLKALGIITTLFGTGVAVWVLTHLPADVQKQAAAQAALNGDPYPTGNQAGAAHVTLTPEATKAFLTGKPTDAQMFKITSINSNNDGRPRSTPKPTATLEDHQGGNNNDNQDQDGSSTTAPSATVQTESGATITIQPTDRIVPTATLEYTSTFVPPTVTENASATATDDQATQDAGNQDTGPTPGLSWGPTDVPTVEPTQAATTQSTPDNSNNDNQIPTTNPGLSWGGSPDSSPTPAATATTAQGSGEGNDTGSGSTSGSGNGNGNGNEGNTPNSATATPFPTQEVAMISKNDELMVKVHESLLHLPQSAVFEQDGKKVELNWAELSYGQLADDNYVAYDKDGKMVARTFKGLSGTTDWAIKLTEMDGLVKQEFYMEADASTFDTNSYYKNQITQALHGGHINLPQMNTMAGVEITSDVNPTKRPITKEADMANIDAIRTNSPGFKSPWLGEEGYTKASDPFDGVLVYLAHLKTGISDVPTLRNMIAAHQVVIPLPNGDKYDLANGVQRVFTRTQPLESFGSSINFFEPAQYDVDPLTGALTITLFSYQQDTLSSYDREIALFTRIAEGLKPDLKVITINGYDYDGAITETYIPITNGYIPPFWLKVTELNQDYSHGALIVDAPSIKHNWNVKN